MSQSVYFLLAGLVASAISPALCDAGAFNKYLVYTREHPRIPVVLTPTAISIGASPIDTSRSTAVIVHGHEGSAYNSLNPMVKDNFLASEDLNVIVIDWNLHSTLRYRDSVNAVPSVAKYLANLIQELVVQRKVSYETLHLVGFDLGAHIVGITGRLLDGQVARITGLNPSGSQWGSDSGRIISSDARYVEIIHTDGGLLFSNGIGTALGDVDFFVNAGNTQPGCGASYSCSHNRAWEVFAATLTNSHLNGRACGSWLQLTLNTCRGSVLAIGNNDIRKRGTGWYRVNTGRTFPF